MQAAPGSAVNSSLLSLYASPDFGRTLSPEGSALADAPAAEGSAYAPSSPEMSQTFTANPMADLEAQQLDCLENVAGLEASSEPQQTGDAGLAASSTATGLHLVMAPSSLSLQDCSWQVELMAEDMIPHRLGCNFGCNRCVQQQACCASAARCPTTLSHHVALCVSDLAFCGST